MEFYIIVLCVLVVYLIIGIGFAIASWLQAAELRVNQGGMPFEKSDLVLTAYFAGFWIIIALYCLRVDVLKNAKPIDWDKLKARNRS
ncbi:conserved hypothetical protein [Vibrio phage 137E35-1]|nr:conserved hypothetical protein [Vibrio phage 137E35-1]CAH9016556.1 conserved hypothetical protein [Vibrio phage 230E39-1]